MREIREQFPEHISTWIDEKELLIGDEVETRLETVINSDTDYVLLFYDEAAANSNWVRKEINWALSAEAASKRTILLTVLIDDSPLARESCDQITKRKYIRISDFSENAVDAAARSIVSELFAMVCRDLEELKSPSAATQLNLIEGADDFLESVSRTITEIVFPFREENPLPVRELHEKLNENLSDYLSFDEFLELLDTLFSKELISGVAYDGYEIHILEEHYRWKTNINRQNKIKVGRVGARAVKSGDKVALDAGSATDELVRVLCNRFKSGSLHDVQIVTNSMSGAMMLLDLADTQGFSTQSCPFKIYLVGGLIRTNTRAIASLKDEGKAGVFLEMLRSLGGVDVGFIGVNGISAESGLSTHANLEFRNKQDIISMSKSAYVLGDSSKIGVIEDQIYATFDDELSLIVDESPMSRLLEKEVEGRNASIIIV